MCLRNEGSETHEEALNFLSLNQPVTRRSFFKLSGITGVKNLKAIGVQGRGSVAIAGRKENWDYALHARRVDRCGAIRTLRP